MPLQGLSIMPIQAVIPGIMFVFIGTSRRRQPQTDSGRGGDRPEGAAVAQNQ